jgi:hypothetical protein
MVYLLVNSLNFYKFYDCDIYVRNYDNDFANIFMWKETLKEMMHPLTKVFFEKTNCHIVDQF